MTGDGAANTVSAKGPVTSEPKTTQGVSAFVRRHLRWNLAAGLLDAMFIALAHQIISNQTVIPLLISSLTGSTVILGLVGAIHSLGFYLPQLLMAGVTEERRYKKPMVMLFGGAGERLPYLFIGLAIWAWGDSAPVLALAAFMLLRTISAVTVGMIMPAWYTLIGKVIPTARRGVFLGVGRGFGALLGVGGGLLAGYLLDTQPYPRNFALCFLLASVAMLVSWLGLAATKEPPDLNVKPRPPIKDYLTTLPILLRRDRNYTRFVLARTVAVLGTMAMSFVILHGTERFSLGGRDAGALTAIVAISQGVMYLVWGLVADRMGHKLVLTLAATLMAAAVLTAMVTPVVGGLYAAFALVGAAFAGDAISSTNIVLEFAPLGERPTYVGLTNTLLAPSRTLAPVVGGVLAGAVGFQGLFMVAAGISLAGAVAMGCGVREPRRTARAGTTR